jgi:hypothetical protein
MRIYTVYLLVIVGLLAVSGTQAEAVISPPNEYATDHFHNVIAMRFS